MNNEYLTFAQLSNACSYLKEDIERFDPRGYQSKRQMRRARGKWRAARRLVVYPIVYRRVR